MIPIPLSELSDAALLGVVEAFILREGTDYGHQDIDFAHKREAVLSALRSGRAQICYYPESDHIDIEPVT